MTRDERASDRITGSASEDDETLADLLRRANPVIRRTLASRRGLLGTADLDDLRSEVLLRLVRRLANGGGADILDFEDYVAGVTFHVVDDWMRRRFPERTRFANRLRYHIKHRPDLTTWSYRGDLVVGLRDAHDLRIPRADVDVGGDVRDMAATLDRILREGPMLFQALVTAFVGDVPRVAAADAEQISIGLEIATADVDAAGVARHFWREIDALPERQRIALLLHMRDERGDTGLLQFLMSGIGPDALAKAIGWTRDELQQRWPELPLDDNTIAALLGATRQQVINLRKCARERLRRRMEGW
jgi:DNA-directed RNA polymerase specialized sigma24 family protein